MGKDNKEEVNKVKYKLHLDGGHTRVVEAKSPVHAQNKYYGSDSHFRTEYGVVKVEKYTPKMRRKARRSNGLFSSNRFGF